MPKMKNGMEQYSLHKQGGWKGQYKRMLRWRDRLLDPKFSAPDFLFAFFQNCYLLREWLLNDGAFSQAELDQFMSTSIEMKICRDLCNGSKHGKISKPSVDSHPIIGYEYLGPDNIGYYLIIGTEDKLDPIEVAKKCIKNWDDLLDSKGLFIDFD